MFLGTPRKHRISPMTIVMITDRKCLDQVIDQELVAQKVTNCLSLTSDHYNRAPDADFISAGICHDDVSDILQN